MSSQTEFGELGIQATRPKLCCLLITIIAVEIKESKGRSSYVMLAIKDREKGEGGDVISDA